MNKKINQSTNKGNPESACVLSECGHSISCPFFQEIEKRFGEIFEKMNSMQELITPRRGPRTAPRLRSGRKLHLDGEVIARIRGKYQLTQTEMGLLLDANLTSVNRWERGKTVPCRRMIEKIIRVRDMGCRKVRRILSEKKQSIQ